MTALVFGIITLFLILFLTQETRKNKKLEKENEGLRHLALQREINLDVLIKSGLPIESIASYLSYRIQFMIEIGASVEAVLDFTDEIGITQQVKIPVGSQSDIDKVRTRIQELVSERFDQEDLEVWVNKSKLNQPLWSKLNSSFLGKIEKSMLVMDMQI